MVTPITEHEATESSLHHFEIRCECGLTMRNTFRHSLELDAERHVAWHDRQAAR